MSFSVKYGETDFFLLTGRSAQFLLGHGVVPVVWRWVETLVGASVSAGPARQGLEGRFGVRTVAPAARVAGLRGRPPVVLGGGLAGLAGRALGAEAASSLSALVAALSAVDLDCLESRGFAQEQPVSISYGTWQVPAF